eukprot:TRINITY_DN181_c0_g1_i3.p1 TRINITY_DN181_c0_g1~~TRINITY_DN181_c0_g1_i3.p1  ORF type:complete len:434 (-),score=98.70 TRINITY_DN181_c0_g1_i3:723-2024(-)
MADILVSLVTSGKLRQSAAVVLLEKLNEHKLRLEDFHYVPEKFLVDYLTQNYFELTLVEQIHISIAIRAPSINITEEVPTEQKGPDITARRKSGRKDKTKSPRKDKPPTISAASAGASISTTTPAKKRRLEDNYDVSETIGKGGFSEVRRAKNKKTGEVVAVKYVKKRENPEKLTNVRREIELMQKLNHPNIVCLKDVFEDESEDGFIYMIMEYVSGGELFEEIVKRGSYSEHDAALVVRQIIDAVAYMHSNNIAHRDLKPENLLCSGSHNEVIKVADFGLSKEIESSTATMCGTPDYVAPEVLRGGGYNNAVDIWSIGVITYVLLCGSPPFYGSDDRDVFRKIIAADYKFYSPEWDSISNEAKDFIRAILVTDPARRPTAALCLEAPWIKHSDQVGKTIVGTESVTKKIISYNSKRKKNDPKPAGKTDTNKK